MSERMQPTLLVEGSAAKRSLEEQHRLMDEYDNDVYESGIDDAAYEEMMAKRELANQATIESRIMDSAELRRMYMMAQHIAELKSSQGDKTVISDKEDKLQELCIAYADSAKSEHTTSNTDADHASDRHESLSQKIDAEELYEQRTEEVDFILDATEAPEPVVAEKAVASDKKANDEVIHDEALVEAYTSDEDAETDTSHDAGIDREDTESEELVQDTDSQEGSEKSDKNEFDENDAAELKNMLAEEESAPRHRAPDGVEESSPIAEALDTEARDGESIEEYEDRQIGRHLDISGLDLDEPSDDIDSDRLSLDGLDLDEPAEDVHGNEEETEESVTGRHRRDRGIAIGGSIWSRIEHVRSRVPERMRRNGRTALIMGVVAAGAAQVAYMLLTKDGSTIGGGNGGGSGSRHALDAQLPLIDTPPVPKPDAGVNVSWAFSDGTGGESLMNAQGIDTSVWYQHQNEFLNRFPDLAYRMNDGTVGLLDQGAGATSTMPRAAQEFWEQYK